ncbi:MAG: hypothetical protein A2W35_02370 [Chloroflexi bacterium RBG_16_57_11]|nr:MAG: hypothetical protein A2W35_02370 [Chloroflexi bacterium RBG_16_57_11]
MPKHIHKVISSIAVLALILMTLPMYSALADGNYQSLPYSQNWSNTGLITVSDDWSGVSGVIGYRGDALTSANDVDPQTVLGQESPLVLDVNANQTNPNTFATGGVAEFHLADPAVALNGSGTADAPYIVFHVNTTGFSSINVGYNLRDLDGSVDNAVQQVALQFRVGESGNFTNVPAGYVADATTGPSLATLVTPLNVTLPAAADNQSQLQIRVITTNAAGNDEWVGIDDISITGTPVVVDSAPAVAGTFPVDGATDFPIDANLTVTFSEPVNVTASWFELSCSVSGIVTTTFSGGPTTFTLDPGVSLVGGESCTLNILANQVNDQDGNDPPDNMAMDFTVGFTPFDICSSVYTPIYAIQGSGLSTPIPGTVTTQGVVVGDFEGSASQQGFYIQDVPGDDDAATSDGIFVFTGSTPLVSVGQMVRVTGYARERFSQTTLNGSNSNSSPVPAANIVNCGTGSVAPTDVTMPFANADFPERFEGMLVRFPQSLVISEYFNYDRFGEIVIALPLDGETRPFTGTAIDEPGAPANARTLANSLRRITLDDANSAQNPSLLRHPNGDPFSLSNRFRGGDTVQNTIGVFGFDFSLYRIFPTGPATYASVNPRPPAPEPVGGTLRVAAMNTLNFFVTADYPTGNPLDNKCGPLNNVECRGWDSDQADEFTRQRTKLLAALAGLDGDIIGLNELENTTGVEPLADIVAGLPGYAYINTGTIGTDAIKVGLIYRPAKVVPVGAYQILDSTDDPRFIDTKSRPVLAQTFQDLATGGRLTVAVNHLKSKGSACDDVGDPDLGDGQGNCNGTRTKAAQALVDWLATDPTGSGDPDFLIMGDLNSYAMEDPIDAVKAGSDDTAGTADDYTNLISHFQGTYAYSYTFDGQAGYLDHSLASASLFNQVTGAADWHINSDEPDVLDYDTSFKPPAQDALYEGNGYRSSDHDPVAVGLNLAYDLGPEFVTGGGWIDSPAGAYTDDPSLTGMATFGLVAMYKKGAMVPNGNAEFQFKAGDLNFHSTSYEWLVVAGSKAKFKGTGTINGEGEYKFMIWANDGNPDTFRIKIWWEDSAGEHVIYDNGTDQAIGGGSIQIHK